MTFSHIRLWHGEDLPSLRDELKRWKDHFIERHGAHNLEEIDLDEKNSLDFSSLLLTTPFLAEKRLIVLKKALEKISSEEQKKLLPLLSKVPESNIVLFIEWNAPDRRKSLTQWLLKESEVKNFKKPDTASLGTWFEQRAKSYGLSLNSALIQKLIARTGTDLNLLDQVLQKLSIWESSQITSELIEALIPENSEHTVFQLTDALGMGSPEKALQLLRHLKQQGEDIHFLFIMLARHLRILLEIKSLAAQGTSSAEIAKILQIPPFVVQKNLKQAQSFSEEELKKCLDKFLDLDRRQKNGRLHAKGEDDHFTILLEQILIKQKDIDPVPSQKH